MRLFILLIAFTTTTAMAQSQIYQWKDASGVAHYSDSPPPSGEYRSFSLKSEHGSTETTTEARSEATARATEKSKAEATAKACEQAKKNVEMISGKDDVQMDINGDGKMVDLSADERAKQLERAKAQVILLCTK